MTHWSRTSIAFLLLLLPLMMFYEMMSQRLSFRILSEVFLFAGEVVTVDVTVNVEDVADDLYVTVNVAGAVVVAVDDVDVDESVTQTVA